MFQHAMFDYRRVTISSNHFFLRSFQHKESGWHLWNTIPCRPLAMPWEGILHDAMEVMQMFGDLHTILYRSSFFFWGKRGEHSHRDMHD